MIHKVKDKSGWRCKFAFFPTLIEIDYQEYVVWFDHYWARYDRSVDREGVTFYMPVEYSLNNPEDIDGRK